MHTETSLQKVLTTKVGRFESLSSTNFLTIPEDIDYLDIDFAGSTLKIPRKFKDSNHDMFIHKAIVKYPSPESNLKPGAVVYCHHLLTHEDNKKIIFGENIYALNTDQIYCEITDDGIKAVGDWVLVEQAFGEIPISPSGLYLKSKPDPLKHIGYVRVVGPEKEVEEGDMIAFKRDSEYVILIEGKKYYRMKYEDIYMKIIV